MYDDPREDLLEAIKKFIIMDDTFSQKFFEDIECTQLVIRIILGRDDLFVKKVVTEHHIKNLRGRSVRLDIFAVDSDNMQYNIELQLDSRGALPERARYNSSLIDANVTLPGDDLANLPEVYVIFVTRKDIFGGKKPLYTINRKIEEMDDLPFNDRSHIIYVNCEKRDPNTALGKLIQDFFCAEPDKMNYSVLANRARYFKEDKEGFGEMCEIMEELIKKRNAEDVEKALEKGSTLKSMEFAEKLLCGTDFTFAKISELTGLSVEKISEIKSNLTRQSAN